MGPARFFAHVAQGGHEIPMEEAERVVQVYRQTHSGITYMWRKLNKGLFTAVQGNSVRVHGHVGVSPKGIHITPGNILIRYRGLERRNIPVDAEETEFREEFFYKDARGGLVKIYGGKMLENIIQSLAALYIRQKMNDFRRAGLRPLLQVHDEIVFLVRFMPVGDMEQIKTLVRDIMSHPPTWCPDIPLDAEVGVGLNFLEAGEKG